jgi:iron complex outermembrane receptor protein
VTEQDLLWASLARAVRTPSRLDRDFFVLVPQLPLVGGPDFDSETADSFELGYRGSWAGRFNYSLTAFYQDYDDLRALQPVGDGTFVIGNDARKRGAMRATPYSEWPNLNPLSRRKDGRW